ncbi:60 kDa SS-A/Ro ribonucleoprotein-like [Acanthaster planci]|uniref:60 kDa SS-A/Ro ribonucleoprotein-like n=1 Tax=Acanthaster planci TaxID=133434 RepID=A0A8B7XWV8_ACAPL|nr:60 kDa SS-A/Ro ribonucleoprotein-like [Acanthaster planci]XP_022085361.1 60 kDa SS-A/Ro ribonucleoprotein-like [Acanthaster planci]
MAENSPVPQSQPLTASQVCNNAGGYVWTLDDMDRLRRFLCLGSETGTYYCKAKELGLQNMECIQKLIEDGRGEDVVKEILEYSLEGRTAKQDPILVALVQCARCEHVKVKQQAYEAMPKICRIPTTLFQFVEFVEKIQGGFGTGWGRAQKRAISRWYNEKNPRQLAYAVTKYRNRNGWTHRDILRLGHVKPKDEVTGLVLKYVVKGWKELDKSVKEDEEHSDSFKEVLTFLKDAETARLSTDQTEVIALVEKHQFAWEHLPTQFLKSVDVWKALLQSMPMTAMIRNLGKLTSIELLKPLTEETALVCERLRDENRLRKARVHPIHILAALYQYKKGKGHKGKLSWTPVQTICDALDDAFYKTFKFVEPTGKRFLLALDVSGSMSCSGVNGIENIMAREASAAMAMVTMRTEQNHYIMAFCDHLVDAGINSKMRLDEVIRTVNSLNMGGTDCALPMIHARKKKIPVDVFIVYTDNETWFGDVHPSQALRDYRKAMKIDAKLIVAGMSATSFSIADPADKGMLDIAGFDSNCPDLIRNFALNLV